MKFSGPCLILSKTISTKKLFRLDLECPEIALVAKPGQFIQVKIPNWETAIWPRPFSIHSVEGARISIFVKIYGKMTGRLCQINVGDKLILTGPLGNGFNSPQSELPVFLVAGGVGFPPLHFFLKYLLSKGYSRNLIHLYSGAKTAEELFASEELESLGIICKKITEDGSLGIKGLVTEPFAADLAKAKQAIVYACGPMAMLKAVAAIAKKHKCQLSLEQLMPCGWGVCNGCAVKIKPDNIKTEDDCDYRLARVCKEGPVFDANEVLWD